MQEIPAPPSAEALQGPRGNSQGEGRARASLREALTELLCCHTRRSGVTGLVREAVTQEDLSDRERNRRDNVSPQLYLQGQGSGNTWDN